MALTAAGAPVMAALTDAEPDRLARLEAQVADLRGLATAPARAALSSVGRERVRERLKG